jgi:hypothetical protein
MSGEEGRNCKYADKMFRPLKSESPRLYNNRQIKLNVLSSYEDRLPEESLAQ